MWKRTEITVDADPQMQCSPSVHFYAQVGKLSPNLRRLHLIDVNLTDVPITSLPNSLESLAITSSYLPPGWFIPVFSPGPAVMPQLKELDLSNSTKTSNADLAVIRGWPDLTTLKLNRCYRITSERLQAITERLHCLEVLGIAGTKCDGVAIQHICRNVAATLRHLDVGKCPHFTDSCAVTVFRLLTNLRSLNVSYCSKLTDVGLRSFTGMNNNLRRLYVSSTAISSDTLSQLKTSLPNCKIVHWIFSFASSLCTPVCTSCVHACELCVNLLHLSTVFLFCF